VTSPYDFPDLVKGVENLKDIVGFFDRRTKEN